MSFGNDGLLPGREYAGALALLTLAPGMMLMLWHVIYNLDGDLLQFGKELANAESPLGYIRSNWPSPFSGRAWIVYGVYIVIELCIMVMMPGKDFKATTTPMGNVPVYKANGMQSYFFALFLLFVFTKFTDFKPGYIYDMFGELLSVSNFAALIFCLFLTIKGYNWPSSTDSGSAGNYVKDLYWGTELHPRIFGVDVKMFTNCRFGMMYWALGIIAYAHA